MKTPPLQTTWIIDRRRPYKEPREQLALIVSGKKKTWARFEFRRKQKSLCLGQSAFFNYRDAETMRLAICKKLWDTQNSSLYKFAPHTWNNLRMMKQEGLLN